MIYRTDLHQVFTVGRRVCVRARFNMPGRSLYLSSLHSSRCSRKCESVLSRTAWVAADSGC